MLYFHVKSVASPSSLTSRERRPFFRCSKVTLLFARLKLPTIPSTSTGTWVARGGGAVGPLRLLNSTRMLIESNTDEASLRRLKLHVVRLLAVENATLTPRCFKMGAGLLKGAMLSALGLFSLGSSHHFGIPRKLGCQLSAHPRLWAHEPGHRAEVGCRGRLPRGSRLQRSPPAPRGGRVCI